LFSKFTFHFSSERLLGGSQTVWFCVFSFCSKSNVCVFIDFRLPLLFRLWEFSCKGPFNFFAQHIVEIVDAELCKKHSSREGSTVIIHSGLHFNAFRHRSVTKIPKNCLSHAEGNVRKMSHKESLKWKFKFR
jgi:hypothetical protein